jgi:hypothetical protein
MIDDDLNHDPWNPIPYAEPLEKEKSLSINLPPPGGPFEIRTYPMPDNFTIYGTARVPFPWEHVNSPTHIEHREDPLCPPVPHQCIPAMPQPDIPLPIAELWAQNIPFPTADELWAQKHAATHHPLSPGSLHLDGHDLPPPHDWKPAEHPLSPGQLHIDADVDSQFPKPDVSEISAPNNQGNIPPPYADDGTAIYYSDATVTPLHSSHATGAEDYSPGTFAADDDIAAYGHLG